MPGPPPAFNPKRSNARVGITVLPAGGRQGDTPAWPLPGKPLKAELETWTDLWASPQAAAWEQLGWTRVVARYTRYLVEGEKRGGDRAARAEARQLEDRLGLTPKAMRNLLWIVSEDEVGERRDDSAGTAPGVDQPPRRRLAAVDSSSA